MCSTTPGERLTRGVAALVLGFVGLGMLGTAWCAVPMLACATFLLIGAVTGWCPTDLLTRRRARRPNTFGYDEGTQHVRIGG